MFMYPLYNNKIYKFIIVVVNMSKLEEKLGRMPILAGVYADKTSAKMIEEVKALKDEGITAVYLENINEFDNAEEYVYQFRNIVETLDAFRYSRYPIGVNIMYNEFINNFETSITLANGFPISFIVNDMIAGTYKINNKVTSLSESDHTDSIFKNFNVFTNILVIGGVNPPYAQRVEARLVEDDNNLLSVARNRSNAIMVKARPDEEKVPLERVREYKKVNNTEFASRTPVIVASKLNKNNIPEYFGAADGFIIGSALRDKNTNLHIPSIKEIVKIVSDYRSSLR